MQLTHARTANGNLNQSRFSHFAKTLNSFVLFCDVLILKYIISD